MKKMLSIAVIGGFFSVIASAGFACEWHSAGHSASTDKNMTVAEMQLPDQSAEAEGMSTFDPGVVKPEEEKAE